jgi:hypothetical protein
MPNMDFKSVLIIDDARTVSFDCAYARTVAAAISLLPDGWDEVWFDHDLAYGETVRPVVDWILQRIAAGDKPELGTVMVHSSNPHGATWIAAQLDDHYPVQRVSPEQLRRAVGTV